MTTKQEIYANLQGEVKKWAAHAVDDLPPNPLQPRALQQRTIENNYLKDIEQMAGQLRKGFEILKNQGCMSDWTQERWDSFNQALQALPSKKEEELKANLQLELGVTDDEIVKWYQCASDLIDKNLLDDAINAFLVLIAFNPRVAAFWIALGIAQEQSDQMEVAAQSYLMAVLANSDDLMPALDSIGCYCALGQIDRAKSILDEVLILADEIGDQEEFKQKALSLKKMLS